MPIIKSKNDTAKSRPSRVNNFLAESAIPLSDVEAYKAEHLTDMTDEEQDGALAQSELLIFAIFRIVIDLWATEAYERARKGPNGDKFCEVFAGMKDETLDERLQETAISTLCTNEPDTVLNDIDLVTTALRNAMITTLQEKVQKGIGT
jgi:hypothetical protein